MSKNAFITDIHNKYRNKIYPVTDARAVYIGDDKAHDIIDQYVNNYNQRMSAISARLIDLGSEPMAANASEIAASIKAMCQRRYSDGESAVTLKCNASGRVITATASNGKSAIATIPYASDSNDLPCSIVVDKKSATKTYGEGYYAGGAVDIDASNSRTNGITEGINSLSANVSASANGNASKDGGKYSVSVNVSATVKNGKLSYGASIGATGTGVGYATCSDSQSYTYSLFAD